MASAVAVLSAVYPVHRLKLFNQCTERTSWIVAQSSRTPALPGYWLQVCNKAESFDSQRANTELKNLGHGVPNITKAIDGLKAQNPALALQLKKAGTTRQARKVYKITVAGVKAIEGLIIAGRERG